MENNNDIVVAASAVFVMCSAYKLIMKRKRQPRRRRWWMVSLNRSRQRYGGTHLVADLLKEPSGFFENFCRMSFEDFEYLLSRTGPLISKKDTKWRKAAPGKERLALTLRFLATGDSYQSLQYLFKISHQLISKIVPEVCEALTKLLKDSIKLPTTEDEWKKIAKDYYDLWNFPNCVGALDGKHIMMQCPINSGSEFFNYKNYFSIVLMALVNANYCFIFVDAGCQGRLSDGAVFRNTELFKRIEKNELKLPSDETLHGQNINLPYIFVADDAFGLSNRIIKPYSGIYEKGSKERIFNYRLSRARRVVENVFGIMASVFRVLRKPMLLHPDKVTLITITCATLHNFLRRSKTSCGNYTPPGMFDCEKENGSFTPGAWRQNDEKLSSLLPLSRVPRKPGIKAKNIRNKFADYFISDLC